MDVMLIEEIKKYEFLYDLKSTDYKNRAKKEQAWEKIANKLGLEANDCQKRWKNLRDNYKKLKMQNLKTPEYEKRRPWKHFESLSFLDNVHSTRRNFGSPIRSKVKVVHEKDTTLDYLQTTRDSYTIEEPLLYFTSPPMTQSKQSSSDSMEEMPQQFEEIFNKPSLNVSGIDEEEFVTDHKSKNCTAQIFEVLANKVTSSNLKPTQINDIESSVVAFVYQKLAEVQRCAHPHQ